MSALVMFLALTSFEALAQEEEEADEFEQLYLGELLKTEVTSVSKHQETLAEAPATVTVLTREDFVRQGWLNVAEALRSVPGMYVSWGRDYYYTGVRGISLPRDVDTRVLVLIDGHTMNNPWSAASNLNELSSLPPEAIERVEVIRGPSSSMYGSNAFSAVVNIISRQPAEKESPSRFLASWGSSSLGRHRAVLGGHHRFDNGLEFSLHALQVDGDGPRVEFKEMTQPRLNRPRPTPTRGVTSGTDSERGYHIGGTASWQGLSLQLYWSDRLKGLPSAKGDSIFNDPYNSVRNTHGFVELRYRKDLGQHTLLARTYYDLFRSREFLHRDPSDWEPYTWYSDDPHTVSQGNDDTFGGEIQGTFQLHASDTLTVGAEVQTHEVTQPTYELNLETHAPIPASVSGGIVGPDGSIQPVSYWNIGIYAQNSFRPFSELGAVLGLRFDHNSLFGELESAEDWWQGVSPRAAIIYTPVAQAVIKLMYGEAFRNPSVFEAFFDDGASVCGNPQAGPERLRNLELAGSLEIKGGITASASLFYTQINHLLEKVPIDPCYEGSGPRLHFINQGSVRVWGGEAGFNLRLIDGVELFANAGFSAVSKTDSGKSQRLPNSPPLVANAGASLPLWKDRLIVSARVHFVSERLNWTLAGDRVETAYLRTDLSLLARRMVPGLFASLTLTNALDVDYRDPVSSNETIPTAIPQDGLAILLKVGYDQ